MGSGIAVSCGVGRRHRSGLALLWLWLWLWRRLTAVALVRPLAWEPPYAAGAALGKDKKDGKKKKRERERDENDGTTNRPREKQTPPHIQGQPGLSTNPPGRASRPLARWS